MLVRLILVYRLSKSSTLYIPVRLAAVVLPLPFNPVRFRNSSLPISLLYLHLYMKCSAHIDIGGRRHMPLMLLGNNKVRK